MPNWKTTTDPIQRLWHKPSEGHKFRGVRFVLSCWASSKGKDLPCFSIAQGRALLHSAWDLPYLELLKTCMDVILPFSIQPPCLQPDLAVCAPKRFADGWKLCAQSSKGLWKEKGSCWSSRLSGYHHPISLRCYQGDSLCHKPQPLFGRRHAGRREGLNSWKL